MRPAGTRIRVLAIAAVCALALLGGIAVASQVIGGTEQGDSGNLDPTAITEATLPAEVPPPPGRLTERTPGEEPPPRARPTAPEVSELKLAADGTYAAKDKNGCEWHETKRVPTIDGKGSEVVLATSCDENYFLHYNPDTGEVTLLVQ